MFGGDAEELRLCTNPKTRTPRSKTENWFRLDPSRVLEVCGEELISRLPWEPVVSPSGALQRPGLADKTSANSRTTKGLSEENRNPTLE